MYCVPPGREIEGLLELLSRNRVALFTPDIEAEAMQFQCVIHMNDLKAVAAVSRPTGHFLQFKLLNGNVFFRFPDRQTAETLCKSILVMLHQPAQLNLIPNEGYSQIPFYSEHMSLGSEESSARGSPSPPPLISPPPICVNSWDKAAVEFGGSYLLDSESAADIRQMVPLEHRFGEFRLLFSPKVHGISIPSFFRKSEEIGPFPSFLLIRDAAGCCVFGAFVKMPWSLSRRYYGTAETFVFTLARKGQRDVAMFGTSGANRLYQYADEKCVVIGGGSKKSDAAISVFSSWLRGTSGACETFGTRHQLSCSAEFVIGDVEFWSILPETVTSVRPGVVVIDDPS